MVPDHNMQGNREPRTTIELNSVSPNELETGLQTPERNAGANQAHLDGSLVRP